MEADHRFGPVAGDEAPDRGARNLDVGDLQQGRPVAREMEEPFEAEGQIEVAARVEAALWRTRRGRRGAPPAGRPR